MKNIMFDQCVFPSHTHTHTHTGSLCSVLCRTYSVSSYSKHVHVILHPSVKGASHLQMPHFIHSFTPPPTSASKGQDVKCTIGRIVCSLYYMLLSLQFTLNISIYMVCSWPLLILYCTVLVLSETHKQCSSHFYIYEQLKFHTEFKQINKHKMTNKHKNQE